jgi:hypothetical protein
MYSWQYYGSPRRSTFSDGISTPYVVQGGQGCVEFRCADRKSGKALCEVADGLLQMPSIPKANLLDDFNAS